MTSSTIAASTFGRNGRPSNTRSTGTCGVDIPTLNKENKKAAMAFTPACGGSDAGLSRRAAAIHLSFQADRHVHVNVSAAHSMSFTVAVEMRGIQMHSAASNDSDPCKLCR